MNPFVVISGVALWIIVLVLWGTDYSLAFGAGFIVAALMHHGTTEPAPGPNDPPDQP